MMIRQLIISVSLHSSSFWHSSWWCRSSWWTCLSVWLSGTSLKCNQTLFYRDLQCKWGQINISLNSFWLLCNLLLTYLSNKVNNNFVINSRYLLLTCAAYHLHSQKILLCCIFVRSSTNYSQVQLHTSIESKLPGFFLRRVDKNYITIYPNRCSSSFRKAWDQVSHVLVCLICCYNNKQQRVYVIITKKCCFDSQLFGNSIL